MSDPGRNAIVRVDEDGDATVFENGTEQVTKDDHFTYDDARQVLQEDGYDLTAGYVPEGDGDALYVFLED